MINSNPNNMGLHVIKAAEQFPLMELLGKMPSTKNHAYEWWNEAFDKTPQQESLFRPGDKVTTIHMGRLRDD